MPNICAKHFQDCHKRSRFGRFKKGHQQHASNDKKSIQVKKILITIKLINNFNHKTFEQTPKKTNNKQASSSITGLVRSTPLQRLQSAYLLP